MERDNFKLGKTETIILFFLVEKKCEEYEVIKGVLGQGGASSRRIVQDAIERLISKELVNKNNNKLELTDSGKFLTNYLRK